VLDYKQAVAKVGGLLLAGLHEAPINVKFGKGERTTGPLMPNFTSIGAEMREYSPTTVKISNFMYKLPLRGDSFEQFLRNSQRLYAFIGSF